MAEKEIRHFYVQNIIELNNLTDDLATGSTAFVVNINRTYILTNEGWKITSSYSDEKLNDNFNSIDNNFNIINSSIQNLNDYTQETRGKLEAFFEDNAPGQNGVTYNQLIENQSVFANSLTQTIKNNYAFLLTDVSPNPHKIKIKTEPKNFFDIENFFNHSYNIKDYEIIQNENDYNNGFKFTSIANSDGQCVVNFKIYLKKGIYYLSGKIDITKAEEDKKYYGGYSIAYNNMFILNQAKCEKENFNSEVIIPFDGHYVFNFYGNYGPDINTIYSYTNIQLKKENDNETFIPYYFNNNLIVNIYGKNIFGGFNQDNIVYIDDIAYLKALEIDKSHTFFKVPGDKSMEYRLKLCVCDFNTTNIHYGKGTNFYARYPNEEGYGTHTGISMNSVYEIKVCGGQELYFTGWSRQLYINLNLTQLELNTNILFFEPYTSTTINLSTNDTKNIEAISPNMTIIVDTSKTDKAFFNKDFINLEIEYNKDINKALAELQQAIITLGGTI